MIRARDGFLYGLPGLPLAFAALPLYVHLPNHYAREYGVPLAALGALLLGARLLDAFVDPWIGSWIDREAARSRNRVLAIGAGAGTALAAGFTALFLPPSASLPALFAWAALALTVSYLGFSTLTLAHQAWGAALARTDLERSRYVSWREALGLVGVLVASALPFWAGFGVTSAALALSLVGAWWAWRCGPQPQFAKARNTAADARPWRLAPFRALMAAFFLNGIASAIPATLVLFFMQDRLGATAAQQPLFLLAYFACAAASMPLWLRISDRIGLANAWLTGMALSVTAFMWAALLDTGDEAWFLAVCAASGAALGADLAMPGSLLARVVDDAGLRGRAEGVFFGWWNLAAKLNLALAAGLALPLLEAAGYTPGATDDRALTSLTFAYCLVPCLLKALAAACLYILLIHPRKDLPCASA